MNAGAGRRGHALALLALALLVGRMAGAEDNAQVQPPQPAAGGNTPVVFRFIPEAPELSALLRVFAPPYTPPFRCALAYYHPMVQFFTFGPNVFGPDGRLRLPGDRIFSAELQFFLATQDQTRPLLPFTRGGPRLEVAVSPGMLREEWTWEDGLCLRRICFQPPARKAVGIRFVVRNQTGRDFNGLRLVARVANPELRGQADHDGRRENDDEIFADPRSGMVFNRDAINREESWMAMGWGPQPGLITGGEAVQDAGHLFNLEDADGSGFEIRLETPAHDLPAGQAQEAVFWMTCAYDQDTVNRDMQNLRLQSGYLAWEDVINSRASQGLEFTCRDAHLTYLFHTLKAWTPWMLHKDDFGGAFFANPGEAEAASAEDIALASTGLLAFGKTQAFKAYLEGQSSTKIEASDIPYLILAYYQYYLRSRDRSWLKVQSWFLEDLLDSLAELDANHDGLPEYYQYADSTRLAGTRFYFQQPSQYLGPSLAAIRAFRCGAELLSMAGAGSLEAAKFKLLADAGTRTLEEKFWRPGPEGQGGYYDFARLLKSGRNVEERSADAVEVVLDRIGSEARRADVFQDLWRNPAWRTRGEQYRIMLTNDEYRISLPRTNQILLAGLVSNQDATEAVNRLLAYSRTLVAAPENMGFLPSPEDRTGGLKLADLNFLELLIRGLAGLEMDAQGIRVHVPQYAQDLNVALRNLKLGKISLDVRVQGAGTGPGRISANGREIPDGAYLTGDLLQTGKVKIVINRAPAALEKAIPPKKTKKKKSSKRRR